MGVANSIFYGPAFNGNHAVLVKCSVGPADLGQDNFVLQLQQDAWKEAMGQTTVAAPQLMDPADEGRLLNMAVDQLENAYKAAGQWALLFNK